MNRFFYYLLGTLIALVVALGAISYFRAVSAGAESAPVATKASPTPSPTPAAALPLVAEEPLPVANIPSLLETPATAATPAPTPAPWTPPNYGTPVPLTYPGFTIIYSPTLRNPLAVQYAMVGGAKPRKWPEAPRIKLPPPTLITANGYARGSMALTKSISLYFGKQAGKNTELMANSAAFNPSTLGGPWAQFSDLEPKWAGEAGWIEVVAGPIFGNPAQQTANGLIVPVAFYRAYRRSYGDTIAFIIPQGSAYSDLKNYITSIATVEAATGMSIFSNTIDPAQRTIVAPAVW